MISSSINTPVVDPRLLESPVPLNWDAIVSAIRQALPNLPSTVAGDSVSPGLVPSDGSSQSYNSPQYSPQSYYSSSLSPQLGHINHDLPFSPTLTASSLSPSPPATPISVRARCAGAHPVKQKGKGYSCSICGILIGRREDTQRHIESVGKPVQCRYCGKILKSARRENQRRHLKAMRCETRWEAGYKIGRFSRSSVEDAFY